MSEPFIGQVIIFAGNFAIRGYAMCNGQLLSIAQNTALFSILGTTYGGNGQTTFALPNLQSRFPIHFGQGPGLSSYDLGQQSGAESVTISTNNMPAHAHPFQVPANENDGSSKEPLNAFLAKATNNLYAATTDGTKMGAGNTGLIGGSQPMGTLPPYLALNFLIALEGIFPSRN